MPRNHYHRNSRWRIDSFNRRIFIEYLLCGSTILRAGETVGNLFSSWGSEPSVCTHLALYQLVVSLYLQHVARPAAHGALGTMGAIAAGAVERSVLHSQLRAVSGLTCEVHTAGEGRNERVRRRFLAGPLQSSRMVEANGLPLQNLRRPRWRRGRGHEGKKRSWLGGGKLWKPWSEFIIKSTSCDPRFKSGHLKASYVTMLQTLQSLSVSICEAGVIMITVSIHCVSYLPGAK